MTRKEALALGISAATIDAQDVDVTACVVHQEFRRDIPGNYRERAIDRLISLGVPWHSEWNLAHDAAKRFLRVLCPYCGTTLEPKRGGGNSEVHHISFACGCGAEVGLTVPAMAGLTFKPGRAAK